MGFTRSAGRILIALLALTCSSFGAITINTQTNASNNTAGTGWSSVYGGVNGTAPFYVVFAFAIDNAGSAGSTTICPATFTDGKGNTATRQLDVLFDNGAASAGVEVAFYLMPVTTTTTSLDSWTITFSTSVTAKAAVWYKVSVGAGMQLSPVTAVGGTGATTGTPSVTTGTITVGDLTVGVCGAESADTFANDADTTNGSWTSTNTHIGVGSGTSGMSVISQGKVQTTTDSTQTFNPTLTSVDTKIAWAQFREVAASTNTSEFMIFFK